MADSNTSTLSSTREHSTAFALPTFRNAAQVILRIGAGLLFMQHGAQKLFGMLGGVDGSGGSVALVSQMGLAGVLEFFGGLLIVVGLFTRPVAAVLAVQMVFAYVVAHLPQGGFPVQNGGELALLFALVFTYLAGTRSHTASLDGLRASNG